MSRVAYLARALADRLGPVPLPCSHLAMARMVDPLTDGCEACLASGDPWVHLRLCLACGHMGCCDESRGRPAFRHFEATGHPIMRSLEPGETWAWCWVDEVSV